MVNLIKISRCIIEEDKNSFTIEFNWRKMVKTLNQFKP